MKRRSFLKTAGATALAATGPAVIIPGRAQPKTLKVLDTKLIVPPGYDEWLLRFVQEWGERNNTRVILDRLVESTAADQIKTEAAGQRGHDLVNMLPIYDATIYEDAVIDLREVYEECEHRYGKPVDLAIKNGYNPRVGKFYSFNPYYILFPAIYRKDLWDAAEKFPDTWEDLRLGGRKVKFLYGPAIGIGLGSDQDGRRCLEAVLFSFGGSVQNAENRPVLKSRQTLEALKFFKALYAEAMSDDVLSWNDSTFNNRAMLAEEISWTLNPVSITRSAENLKLPIEDKLTLARSPLGPERRLAPGTTNHFMSIWKFADNIEGAKQG
jgi:multiple sugar transport system substrate-binding protein